MGWCATAPRGKLSSCYGELDTLCVKLICVTAPAIEQKGQEMLDFNTVTDCPVTAVPGSSAAAAPQTQKRPGASPEAQDARPVWQALCRLCDNRSSVTSDYLQQFRESRLQQVVCLQQYATQLQEENAGLRQHATVGGKQYSGS